MKYTDYPIGHLMHYILEIILDPEKASKEKLLSFIRSANTNDFLPPNLDADLLNYIRMMIHKLDTDEEKFVFIMQINIYAMETPEYLSIVELTKQFKKFLAQDDWQIKGFMINDFTNVEIGKRRLEVIKALNDGNIVFIGGKMITSVSSSYRIIDLTNRPHMTLWHMINNNKKIDPVDIESLEIQSRKSFILKALSGGKKVSVCGKEVIPVGSDFKSFFWQGPGRPFPRPIEQIVCYGTPKVIESSELEDEYSRFNTLLKEI